jgi:uncharacterized integral membrane protein
MYLSLIITFLLLLVIIITAIQNSMPLDFKFFTLNFQISITALIFFSSLIGGAIVAVLALPKLATKSLHGRSMNREIQKLKEENLQLGKKSVGEFQKEYPSLERC